MTPSATSITQRFCQIPIFYSQFPSRVRALLAFKVVGPSDLGCLLKGKGVAEQLAALVEFHLSDILSDGRRGPYTCHVSPKVPALLAFVLRE